jgi:hypothetical protein
MPQNNAKNNERECKMEGVKTNERRVTNREAAPYSVGDCLPDTRDSGYQAGNHCSPPETHLPSGKNVPNKRSGHHEQEDYNPCISQFRTRNVRLIVKASTDMQIDHDENH